MRIERAGPEHLDGVRAIAADYGNLDEWPARPDALDFELREAALWVAHEDGAVARLRGRDAPRGGGAPRRHVRRARPARPGDRPGLLEAALPADGVRITFASGDPRALPLYVRAGMRPLAPLLYLQGTSTAGAAAAPVRVDGHRGGRARRGARAAAAGRSCSRSWPRPARTRCSARAPAPTPSSGPSPAAPGSGRRRRTPASCSPSRPPRARPTAASRLALCGPHPALAPLLAAGFRVTGADTYMASHPDALDLLTYLPEVDLG